MITAELRQLVRQRAAERCEYCHLPEDFFPDAAFHVEHIIARQHGGGDEAENLALACHHCNLKKGPNIAGLDPQTGELTRLFHPRDNSWDDHFSLLPNGLILGRTDVGRTTEFVLAMNSDIRVAIRSLISQLESQNELKDSEP